MNGVHDMGGAQGFGPVIPEAEEPLFHAPWERRALAVTLAMGACGQWNIDQSRAVREQLPPAVYLSASYYEIWIRALEQLLVQRGLVSADELAGRAEPSAGVALKRLRADQVDATLARGSPTERAPSAPARFAPGQRVLARNMHPAAHTRLPRYVRGHPGRIERVHGAHVFADRHAQGLGPPFEQRPEWLYTVVFEGRELWGEQAGAGLQAIVDIWEPCLQGLQAGDAA